jgi:REP element-mobilizing transposase RayT
MPFIPFNPVENVQRTRRALPHWFQEGRTYFVTFRLADSMPQEKREQLEAQRNAWMHAQGLKSLDEIEFLSEEDRKEYHRIFTVKIHELLDAGYGSCALRDPENAQIVSNALMFFDGQRCEMISFVVMPNHVHVIIECFTGHLLADVLHSWKSFTAHAINKALNRTGPLWQKEYHDRFIRDAPHFQKALHYLEQNPVKARLVADKADWPWSSARSAAARSAAAGSAVRPAGPGASAEPLSFPDSGNQIL